MATARLGSVVTDIRGSIGQQTYGRGPGGIFIRNRTIPEQPPSDERDIRQAAWAAITQAWSGGLSQAERDTWNSYARQHPIPDRWGQPRSLSGICHFNRCNVQRYREDLAITAAVAPLQPPPPMPSFTFTTTIDAALEVTGTLTPDVAGTYYLHGTNDGQPTWKLAAMDWWLFYSGTYAKWYITDQVGQFTSPWWVRVAGPAGAYEPHNGATGTATATASNAQSSVTIATPPVNYPEPVAGLRLTAYAGALVTVGRNFYRTPYRYVGTNHWTGTTWSWTPWTIPTWQLLAASGRLFLRLVATQADGATSVAGQNHANT